MKKQIAIEIIAALYIMLFLYTGISKLMEYTVFKEQLSASPLLSPIASIVSISVPIIEFIIVILLIVPRWRLKGLLGAVIIMLLFTSYITSLFFINDQLPCSCGGIIQELSWEQHLIFNACFIALGIIAIILEKQVIKMNRLRFSY